MAVEVIMPKAGSEMEEGEIVQWFKQEGDEVKEGEVLLEIVTDKVNMEVEAEATGTLLKILAQAGDVVPVVQTIAWIGEPGEKIPGANESGEVAPAETIVEKKVDYTPVKEVEKVDYSGLRATPAARAYARKKGIDLSKVKGSGPKGRIHKDDVLDYKLNSKVKISPLAERIAKIEGINTESIVGTGPNGKIMKADIMAVLHGAPKVEAAPKAEVAPISIEAGAAALPGIKVLNVAIIPAIGFFVLNTGTGLITGKSIDGIIATFNTLMPGNAAAPASVDIGAEYGTQIGVVMLIGFAFNILVARFTKWKSVFLTGHMLYWFPFVFIAAGVDAGLTGGKLIGFAAVFTGLYMVIAPNLMRPLVKAVTGKDDFTIAHPTTTLSVIAGFVAGLVGDKSKSCEDLKLPESLGFLREVSITGSISIALVYLILFGIVCSQGLVPAEVFGYTGSFFTYLFTHSVYFGVGVTVMLGTMISSKKCMR